MRRKEVKGADRLKSLGSKGGTEYPVDYSPGVLEWFGNRFPEQEYVVELKCPEFTSLCPKTKQPDFANITIRYRPNGRLVESKSLKLYLFSFRNHGSFHEDCVNTIARDLFNLMAPRWIEVVGEFMPRGGISIHPKAYIRGKGAI
jgi:7-cyano-7-deazaguanine reductase